MIAPTVFAPDKQGASEAEEPVVRFGIVTFYNPRLMVLRYQPFLDALDRRMPYRFELVLSPTYRETVDRLERGEIDIAYLGPVTYIRARRRFETIPVARLNTMGRATYQAVVCVREDSPIERMEELRGTRFAFGSSLSTSSHLYPRLMLKKAGIRLEDLESFTYYRHHDRAAKAVLTGDADACGIRDVVAERYRDRGLKYIAWSDPIPNFPLVARATAPDSFITLLRETLLSLDSSSERDSLEMSDWTEELRDGFAPVDARDYDMIEKLMRDIFGENAFEGELEAPGATPPPRLGGGNIR